MDGTVVYFESRVPSRYELDNCKKVIMTDSNVWDPTNERIAIVSVTSGVTNLPIVETSERLRISCMSVKTAKTANSEEHDDCDNEMIPFDDALFLNRMIGKVHVATAYRDANVAFVGSKDRSSRPYAADPALTEWLVTNTTNLGRDEVLEVLAAMNAKYANVTDPALPRTSGCVA
ncbi:hypothetical protein MHU86_24546 [Fragilaria crotonensis]|nr:hypothetical protein MHU86_24546 [Fragilaria crotonensis]